MQSELSKTESSLIIFNHARLQMRIIVTPACPAPYYQPNICLGLLHLYLSQFIIVYRNNNYLGFKFIIILGSHDPKNFDFYRSLTS